ncbi:Hypothetical predicted protein [Lecanosticta acicola]|uniref:Methyltransferase type 11 domain-containing protein n=1 Tax=Lecanosticta acicola TaxID=111012 RepID=A0AAI8Z3S2_9PEZI|nr:Hypothetical predicted protein [Lecanosticta acicola]
MASDRLFDIETRMASTNETKHDPISKTFAFSKSDFDWDNYARCRPVYPESLYQEILAHHAAHGAGFQSAHDMGAGYGLVTRDFLSRHFNHTWTSDPVEHNLSAARKNLKELDASGKITVVQAAAEDDWLPKASVDLVAAFTCLHWADETKYIPTIAAQLKPGGSFVAVVYCCPFILDNPEADALWSRIFHRGGDVWIREAPKAMERFQEGLNSTVPLPTDLFLPGAKRVRYNAELLEEMGDHRDPEFPLKFGNLFSKEHVLSSTKVGKEDVCETRTNIEDWSVQGADIQWFRGLMDTFQILNMALFEEDLKELEEVLKKGDGKGKVTVCWVVDVVLATRKMG